MLWVASSTTWGHGKPHWGLCLSQWSCSDRGQCCCPWLILLLETIRTSGPLVGSQLRPIGVQGLFRTCPVPHWLWYSGEQAPPHTINSTWESKLYSLIGLWRIEKLLLLRDHGRIESPSPRRAGELILVVRMLERQQAEQLSFHPGPYPGFWVGPPQYLHHLWSVVLYERASPSDPML